MSVKNRIPFTILDLQANVTPKGWEYGIEARVGGTQALAYPTTEESNRIDIVNNNEDSVLTIEAIPGAKQYFYNRGLNKVAIYPRINEQFLDGITLKAINEPFFVESENQLSIQCFEVGVWTTV